MRRIRAIIDAACEGRPISDAENEVIAELNRRHTRNCRETGPNACRERGNGGARRRFFNATLGIWMGGAALAAMATGASADVTVDRTTCFAPCDVFFDARTPDWETQIDQSFHWDFGDPGAGTWQRGADRHSRNVDTGFVAGHVYETPGQFSATLDVGGTKESVTIQVLDPDVVFAGQSHCVSSSGDFAGCPAGATQHITSDFDLALASLCDVDGRDARCLFRRGDSFTAGSTTAFRADNRFLVGAFGDPLRAVIVRLQGGSTALFERLDGSGQKVVMDLTLLGEDTGTQAFFDCNCSPGSGPTQWFLALRVDVLNVHVFGKLYTGNDGHVVPDDMPHHVSVVASSSLSSPANSADFYSFTERLLFMGNDFGDKDGEEHVVRIGWAEGAVISHNRLGRNCGEIRHVLKVVNSKAGDQGNTACTRDFIVANNVIDSCVPNDYDVEIGPNSNRGEECVERFIVERNHFRMANNIDTSHRSLVVTVGPSAIRSNIFDLSGPQTSTNRGITIRQKNATQVNYTMPDDIRVLGNTCWKDGETLATPRCVEVGGASVDRPLIRNNVLYSPDGTGAVVELLNGGPTDPDYCEDGTVGSCNLEMGTTPFMSAHPTEPADYRPSAAGPLPGAGECAGLDYVDLDRTARSPLCTIGAYESVPEPKLAPMLLAATLLLHALSVRGRRIQPARSAG